ncbi:MAG TPA: hypothetical protein VHA11_08940 [Bryobacteraceae bacterium]|nr:hypothetical protein [Bryobacteraceae bacterium]
MNGLLAEALALWQECPPAAPRFTRTFSPREQESREQALDRFLAAFEFELHHVPCTRAARDAARERINEAFLLLAQTALDLDKRHLDLLLAGGFSAIGSQLGREARRFDPHVNAADILQASRNAWTACGLQLLLGRPLRLTGPIFAYSMLYPYTDNYLDDPAVSRDAKLGFSRRFGERLSGGAPEAANAHECAIWGLVEIIEREYERSAAPEVYQSLLRIHAAQVASLRLLRRGAPTEGVDVAALVFEKGGASVLADGYLAAGTLTEAQARFVFGWGVVLQLADDLQDVRQDCADGVRTLFSDGAAREALDALTSRALAFSARVMGLLEGMAAPGCQPLEELMVRSAASMFIRSIGDAAEYYTPAYVAEAEKHSPFRFGFLNARRREFERRGPLVAQLFDAFLEGEEDEPAFPLLPGSLLPRY